MRRRALVVLAWVIATGMSVLVAYAAVGEVRDRVVDQPQPLSIVLSTTTSSGSPADEVSSTSIGASAAVDPIDPTATSTTTLGGTDGPSGSTSIPVTTPESGTAPTSAAEGGEIKTYSTVGGRVSIEVFPDHLVLLGAVPASGYSVAEQEISPRRIEIEFKSGGVEVKFNAQLQDDGTLDVDLHSEDEHH